MPLVYIGIDNGTTSGAIVALGQCRTIIHATTIPSVNHRSRTEVDIRKVHLWFTEVTGGNLSNAVFGIEEPNNSRNASTAYSVAACFHSFRGFFETKFLPFQRITPQSWQLAMLGKVPKGETKSYALAKSLEIWPEERFLASPRCKTPHPGIIDAALIAEYIRRKEQQQDIINPTGFTITKPTP
ncbi:MAG: hypothetical protein EBS38_08160 [Actinobacteria bacterium]|nr:hypothetical protein [Actinomycetota bacterium]